MAGKRSATSDLNHDNWNQEEEPEERGAFQVASDDILKNRIIKTARRRNPIREDNETKSAFVGFTGFSNKPASADFSFLKGISKTDSAPKTNGIDNQSPLKSGGSPNLFSQKSSTNIFGATAVTSTNVSTNIFTSNSTTSTNNTIVPSSAIGPTKSERYYSKLKGLNETVSKWITKKVEENPLISLQPIFKDYEKYLAEIDKEQDASGSEELPVPILSKTTPTKIPTFNFIPYNTKAFPDSSTLEKSPEKKDEPVPTFKWGGAVPAFSPPTFKFGAAANAGNTTKSFGSLGTSSEGLSTPSFSFTSSQTSTTGSLTFPSGPEISFGSAPKSEEKPKEESGSKEDDDEPPKVEVTQVVESDYLYMAKCKVFVKKGESYGDRGVGNLYLKPIVNSEKVQLIVRANTNLGNLLLNFILSESIPIKRLGKKDVMLVAIPTPDAKPPPTPLLLRVKSPEEADSLLGALEKYKK
ncbi:nuclear pore complex protein Nup50 [Euwallacea fornicatus]|uniref:nuclear pore complex protein Nup50 n=1 Tax=Euwallacea fornicatus TaxID=995702 RepID=UPI00338EDF75